MPRYRLVPVVVTAAHTSLGRLVVERLKAEGAEVRAVADKPVDDLGVPTSRADWDDAERLGAVIEGAHTVIHLAGRRRNAALLAAAEGSGLVRIVSTVPVETDGYEVVVVEAPRFRRDDAAVAEALIAADRRT